MRRQYSALFDNLIITINAPYGIVDNPETGRFEKRKDLHSIFNVGYEYILFLRVDEIFGELHYYSGLTFA